MKDEVIIKVRGLSKTYKLYNSKKDFIKEALFLGFKKYHYNFEALKNVNFDVKRGEIIGIIGKNGSGKSTLMKILASVVTPTSGTYVCKGKVAGLLELAGGFDREVSGIQNIKFLLAIMGFSNKDIPELTKKVIDFSEIGDFAYQAVKKYSSGMYMRLAFSLAINIDPDILVIDEVLAVGDLAFKKKSFNKIIEFKKRGKTILICSHSLTTISDFCSKAIWIHKGELKSIGNAKEVTKEYSSFLTSTNY